MVLCIQGKKLSLSLDMNKGPMEHYAPSSIYDTIHVVKL